MLPALVFSMGGALVGTRCVSGASKQLRSGEICGAAARSRGYRKVEFTWFCQMFAACSEFGPIALTGTLLALVHAQADG